MTKHASFSCSQRAIDQYIKNPKVMAPSEPRIIISALAKPSRMKSAETMERYRSTPKALAFKVKCDAIHEALIHTAMTIPQLQSMFGMPSSTVNDAMLRLKQNGRVEVVASDGQKGNLWRAKGVAK